MTPVTTWGFIGLARETWPASRWRATRPGRCAVLGRPRDPPVIAVTPSLGALQPIKDDRTNDENEEVPDGWPALSHRQTSMRHGPGSGIDFNCAARVARCHASAVLERSRSAPTDAPNVGSTTARHRIRRG